MTMMSQYLAHKLLNGILKSVPYTAPNPPYLAMLLEPPAAGEVLNEVGSGGTNEELEASGYARTPIIFATAKHQRIYNSEVVRFPRPKKPWVTDEHRIEATAIMDAASGGNMLFWGHMEPPRIILANYPAPGFPVSNIRVDFEASGCMMSDYMAQVILNGVLRSQQFNPPETVYLALLKDPPARDTSSVSTIEVDANDYVRESITFEDAENGWSINDELVEFDRPQQADWADEDNPVVAWAIMDAAVNGRWLFAREIEPRVVIAGSKPVQFEIGEIKIMLNSLDQ